MKKRWIIFGVILLSSCIVCSRINAQPIVYQTWAPWEIDSLLTAWAIKRYVHTDAKFIALPHGTEILPETSIDVPDSPYRRSARTTAFDEVIRINHIDSECVKKILPIVRLLELAPWRKSENREAEDFEYDLRPLLPRAEVEGGLNEAFEYIDNFCQKITEKIKK